MKIDYRYRAGLFFFFAVIICFISGKEFLKMKIPDKVYPSAGITKIADLSEYNPNLKGTNGNSAVYYYDSGNPGGTFLLLGGTHPNEPAGFISALLMAENLKVTPFLLILTYFVLTVAELFISPLGISFVSKVAPPQYQGVMQGGWLGATAIGNSLLFVGAVLYDNIPIWMTWTLFVTACTLSMFTMIFMLKWLERVAK